MTRGAPIRPDTTAFLAMDYQVGVVSRFEQGPAAVRQAAVVMRACRAAGVLVVHVRVAFRAGHPEVSERNPMFMGVAGAGALVEDNDDAAGHPDLPPVAGDVVVTKRRVSAFAGSDLSYVLSARGVDTLILAGVATSGVVLSTARAAADRDYRLLVVGDACADADPEVHRVLLHKVLPAQAEVLDAAEVAAALPAP